MKIRCSLILVVVTVMTGFAQYDNAISRETPLQRTRTVAAIVNDNDPDRFERIQYQLATSNVEARQQFFDALDIRPEELVILQQIDLRYRNELEALLEDDPYARVELSARTRNLLTQWGQEINYELDETLYDRYAREMMPDQGYYYNSSRREVGLPGAQ